MSFDRSLWHRVIPDLNPVAYYENRRAFEQGSRDSAPHH